MLGKNPRPIPFLPTREELNYMKENILRNREHLRHARSLTVVSHGYNIRRYCRCTERQCVLQSRQPGS
jgi:hypothetical protein